MNPRSTRKTKQKAETKSAKDSNSSGSEDYQDSSEDSESEDDDYPLSPKKKGGGGNVKTGSYPCLLCDSVFPRRMFLHQHQRKAHTVKTETGKLVVLRMKCSYPNCTQQFTGHNTRKSHEAHVHSDQRPVTCSVEGCDKTFKAKGGLYAHIQRFHSDKRHQCNICHKEFTEKAKLKKHIPTHLSEVDRKKFSCDLCDKSYLKKASLKEHQITDHPDSRSKGFLHKCPVAGCGKAFPSNARKNSHMKMAHLAAKTIKCEVSGCDKKFILKSHMTRHMTLSHPPEDSKPVICTVQGCFKSFKTQDGLRLHTKNMHEKERTVILQGCGECGEQFEFRKQLSLHMKKCHEGNPCTFCGKRLANLNSLRAHVKRVHTGKKEFKCSVCDKIYLFEYEMKEHVRRQHEESRFFCYFCSKPCTTRFSLFNHMNGVHLKEKQFKCPEPSCRFASVSKAYCKIHYKRKHGKSI